MLASQLLDAIFARLALVYTPRRLEASWAPMSLHIVRNAWGAELDGLSSAQVLHGLQRLPEDFPPTVVAFHRLCLSYVPPPPRLPALPDPRGSRILASLLPRFQELAESLRCGQRDPKAWAKRLQRRELAGERLTRFQAHAWRAALPVSGNGTDTPTESTT